MRPGTEMTAELFYQILFQLGVQPRPLVLCWTLHAVHKVMAKCIACTLTVLPKHR